MAKKPKAVQFGASTPREPRPRVLTQQEEEDRRLRSNFARLTGPSAMRIAQAIVALSEDNEPVTLETDTHILEVTVTPK